VPPYYPGLFSALAPGRSSFVTRRQALPVFSVAVTYATSTGLEGVEWYTSLQMPGSLVTQQAVAAAVGLIDDNRPETAYLALPHCVNDSGSLERLLFFLAEQLSLTGVRRLVGPTGLSPHLGSGLLQNHWDLLPPLHTAYQPPYFPELFLEWFKPVSSARLFYVDVPAAGDWKLDHPALLKPVQPRRFSRDLLPVFQAGLPEWNRAGLPAADEVDFLLNWIAPFPTYTWLAIMDDLPVGFILLQPDLSERLKQARGGRLLLRRLWLGWAKTRPVHQGRLLFGGVLPEWRGRGVGSQLLNLALDKARRLGWDRLVMGPLSEQSDAARLLSKRGGRPQQHYLLYEWDLG
jgi:GNAT superfamily N-acetyltransferase